MTVTTFPPDAPTINGRLLTVDMLLNNPTYIQKRLTNMLLQRLIATYIFADGAPAPGGAVIFDRILDNDLYTTRDVQEIEPGSEFPIVDDGEVFPNVAKTAKRGGAIWITYEAKRRNAWDVVNRKLVRLTNTIAKKIDTVGMSVLNNDPDVITTGGTDWSNAATRDPIGDISSQVAIVDNLDLGYHIDTVIVNPVQVSELFSNRDIREALPKENAATNPILSGQINGLLGLNWVSSNRQPVGTATLLQAKTVGSLHDEIPQYSRVIDQPINESYLIQAARICVPVITDPKCVRRLTGL